MSSSTVRASLDVPAAADAGSGAPIPETPLPPATDAEKALWTPLPASSLEAPDVVEVLGAVPLFSGLSRGELKKLSRRVHHRSYHAGEVVFREGDPGAGMYVLQSGEVRIVIRAHDGSEQELALLSDRQFFGEMALLSNGARSASAVAVTRAELLGFFEPDLEALIERDSRIGSRILWNLARLMANRLRATNEAVRAQRLRPSGGPR